MRDIGKREIDRFKCTVCGSKNKLISAVIFNNEFHGHVLRCCSCGHMEHFIDSTMMPQDFYSSNTRIVPMHCIQTVPCPHTDCPYYNLPATDNTPDITTTTNKDFCENPLHEELSVKQINTSRFL